MSYFFIISTQYKINSPVGNLPFFHCLFSWNRLGFRRWFFSYLNRMVVHEFLKNTLSVFGTFDQLLRLLGCCALIGILQIPQLQFPEKPELFELFPGFRNGPTPYLIKISRLMDFILFFPGLIQPGRRLYPNQHKFNSYRLFPFYSREKVWPGSFFPGYAFFSILKRQYPGI